MERSTLGSPAQFAYFPHASEYRHVLARALALVVSLDKLY